MKSPINEGIGEHINVAFSPLSLIDVLALSIYVNDVVVKENETQDLILMRGM